MDKNIKLGHFTMEQREAFLQRKVDAYLVRHPGVNKKKARKYARVKWANKINNIEKKRKHVNPIRIVE